MKSKRPLKVHPFKLIAAEGGHSVADLLAMVALDDLEDRSRELKYSMRMECEKAPHGNQGYWLLDFSKLRYDGGPGRASRLTATESFHLEQGEGFSEETAMLYDPTSGYAVVQYNHHGPRPNAIADYLGIYDGAAPTVFEFLPQLRSDAQARLKTKKIFTRIEMKVVPARLSQDFKNKNMALTKVLQERQKEFGGDVVSITIGLEPHSKSKLTVAGWLDSLNALATEDEEVVSELKISGKDTDDSPIDPIDLIAEKVHLEFNGVPMDDGLRYIREERWNRLVTAFHHWKKEGVIP